MNKGPEAWVCGDHRRHNAAHVALQVFLFFPNFLRLRWSNKIIQNDRRLKLRAILLFFYFPNFILPTASIALYIADSLKSYFIRLLDI